MNENDIVKELGRREKQYRISYPMSQEELSLKSGVSVGSIVRFEKGEGIQFSNLVKILQALGLEKNLDLLLPDPSKSPEIQRKILKSNTSAEKMRVSKNRKKRSKNPGWKWGDEQ